jgi:hypothetical protein
MIDWPCYNATRHTAPAPLENAAQNLRSCQPDTWLQERRQTYGWIGKNKLSAEARASVVSAPLAIAFEEVVDECLCRNGVGFWPEW